MHPAESQQHAAELRQAFLRHLPKRVDRVCRRGRQLLRAGWDINALSLLHRDAQALAGAAGRYGALEASETLYALELALQPFVEGAALPDAAQGERIAGLVQRLASLVQSLSLRGLEGGAERPSPAPGPFGATTPLHRPAPPAYWRRFGLPDLERAPPAAAPAPTPVAPPAPAARPPAESAAAARPPARPAVTARRIYLLDPGEPLLSQSAQLLREEGHDVESFASAEEFLEVLGALTPDLAIVAGLDEAGLRTIGDRLRQARQRGGSRVLLMVIGERDDLPSRLAALRAGADAFHGRGIGAAELVAEVREQLRAEPADAYRVLVVEDDRSQALFAESILRNAGFETRSETDPLRVLAVLEEFEPDLILMDLYMPNVDGMELTAIIRERERFVGVPIVFLSGEQDEEKHFAALDAGGDDFLAKPIRPKHLISAVTNRIRRARVSRRAQRDPARRDPATGLYQRPLRDRPRERGAGRRGRGERRPAVPGDRRRPGPARAPDARRLRDPLRPARRAVRRRGRRVGAVRALQRPRLHRLPSRGRGAGARHAGTAPARTDSPARPGVRRRGDPGRDRRRSLPARSRLRRRRGAARRRGARRARGARAARTAGAGAARDAGAHGRARRRRPRRDTARRHRHRRPRLPVSADPSGDRPRRADLPAAAAAPRLLGCAAHRQPRSCPSPSASESCSRSIASPSAARSAPSPSGCMRGARSRCSSPSPRPRSTAASTARGCSACSRPGASRESA
ncbi:MAG: response regulator [Xanthomonadales bacterium]|nr:response regulator [Xanthomonadales bacterium]